MLLDPEMTTASNGLEDLLKYSLIMVACVPVWCIYPFVQKYFVKGVMVGSIKG
jgi:multiple sugar transport system permease protein/putative aldouronate transport system permease protein